MSKLITLSLLFFLLHICSTPLAAQHIYNAEVYKEFFSKQGSVEAWVWRQGGSKPFIMYDWGDGSPLDTLEMSTSQFLGYSDGTPYYVNFYRGKHTYDTSGMIAVGFRDSFLVDDIANIENSGEKELVLYDTINLLPIDDELAVNTSPVFFSKPDAYYAREDGAIVFNISIAWDDFWVADIYKSKLTPFPADGYTTPPPATDSLYMTAPFGATMIWDRPVEAGRYALGINVREFRPYLNNDGQMDTALVSTTMRAMTILVTDDMLVSNRSVLQPTSLLSVYPNPAKDIVQIQLPNLSSPADLTIQNLQGQTLLRDRIQLSPALQTHEIQVADWPAGVYVLRVQSGERQWVRKFVVE